MEERQKKFRRNYDKQSKESTVRLIIEGGKRASDETKDLGIKENVLYRWKREMLADNANAFPGKGKLKLEDEEIRQLKNKLRDVTEERDISKKALAYFS